MRPDVYLRLPEPADARAFIAAVGRSGRLHRPWVSPPGTPAAYRAYLKRMSAPIHRPFLICLRSSHEPVGVVNITNIVLGPLRSAYLGYYAFSGHERKGYMRQGLRLVIRHAFRVMRLHRLEANIQPSNRASIALAASCGFQREGYSPRYLKIGGRWRDHERWAIRAS